MTLPDKDLSALFGTGILFTLMHMSFVSVAVAVQSKSPIAIRALVLHFAGVKRLVVNQILFQAKPLGAYFALVRFLAGVHSLMLL